MVTYTRSWVLASLAAAQLALTACKTEPRCGSISRCDIRDRDCQERALRYASCLRARDERTDLDVDVVMERRDDFLAREVAAATAADTRERRLLRRALALFSLSPATSDVEQETLARYKNVVATYSSDPPHVTIVDRSAYSSGSNVLTLVHEMVHALQDAAGELDPDSVPPRFDALLASNAVVEGEATLYTDEAWAAGTDLPFYFARYATALNNYRAYSRSFWSPRVDAFSELYSRFTYAYGASYLFPLRRNQGPAALAEAHAMLPVSSAAVMRLDTNRSSEPENDLGEDAVPVLPDLTLIGSIHLGRFAYLAYNQLVEGELRFLLPSSSTFVADTMSVFTDDQEKVAAVWRLRFEDAAELEAVAAALPDADWPERVHADGTDLWIVAAENEDLRDAIPKSPSFQAAAIADLGEGAPTEGNGLACTDIHAHEP